MSEIQLLPSRVGHLPESLTQKMHAPCFPMTAFEPHPLLRNPHVATVIAALWPRKLCRLQAATERLFDVEPGTGSWRNAIGSEIRSAIRRLSLFMGSKVQASRITCWELPKKVSLPGLTSCV